MMITLKVGKGGYSIIANGKTVGYAKMVTEDFSDKPTHLVYRKGLGFLGVWSIKEIHRYFATIYA